MKNQQNKNWGAVSSVIAALCIVIYLFALVQAAVRLYLSIEDCRIIATNEFTYVKNTAVSAGSVGFMDERFIQTINNSLLSTKMLEAIIITDPNREYAFEKQKGRAITWNNNSPRFINRLSFSNTTYYDPLPINNLRNANIKAVANAFDYAVIAKILRETLLLILIGFAVSFFTMLMQILLGASSDSDKHVSSTNNQYTHPNAVPQIIPQININNNSKEFSPKAEEQNYTQQLKPEHEVKSEPVSNSAPKEIYSPHASGWEEYTKDKLDAEIHRCASTEKDLSFITIEFAVPINDAVFKSVIDEAETILTGRDMLLENKNQSIYAILSGTDLNSAITKSENFLKRIKQISPECDLSIGITSRSGRLVNAERLMFESKEALKRAKKDPATSIIAFKSDPDKYRAFISQR